MSKFYTFLAMLFCTVAFGVNAQKTVTFTTENPDAITLFNTDNYTYASWNGNTAVVSLPSSAGIQINVNSGYQLNGVTVNGTALSGIGATGHYLSASDMPDGATIALAVGERVPKKLVVIADPSMVYLSSDYAQYDENNISGDRWNLTPSDYGSTSFYCKDGYALSSLKDQNGVDYLYTPGSTYATIYHSSLPSATTTITVEAYDLAASRTSSITLNVVGDPSNVSLQRNGENSLVVIDKNDNNQVAFNPETEVPMTLSHALYGRSLYKVEVNGDAVAASGSRFMISPKDGDVVTVHEAFPDVKVPVTFNFENSGTEGALSVRVDNTIVPVSEWSASGYTVQMGSLLQLSLNSSDFEIESAQINGETFYSSIEKTVADENGYVVNVKATAKRPYTVTINCDPEAVDIFKGYTTDKYELTGETTVLTVLPSDNCLNIKPKTGYVIDYIYSGDVQQYSPLYVSGDMELDIYSHKFDRDLNVVVYFQETSWNYKSFVLSQYDYTNGLRTEYEPENGYNFYKYNEVDLPFGLGAYPTPVAYLNGELLESQYGSYPGLAEVADNSVIKVYASTPAEYTVSYTVDPKVSVAVLHDHVTAVDGVADHTVFDGTEVLIIPAGRSNSSVIVKVNGENLTAREDGSYLVKVKGNTSVAVEPGVQTGIEDVAADAAAPADVYNLQGICIMRNADADDVKALPAGIYIVGGRKTVVSK